MKPKILICALMITSLAVSGQTFTMGKKCREKNSAASSLLKEKKYQDALGAYQAMEKSCTTKDAKEATGNGKAEALNGLGRYDEAIKATDGALKVTNNKSLMAYFQRAAAQTKLKQYDAANTSFGKMISLTEKNQDKKARASNYALISQLHWQYLGNKDSAIYFLEKAIALDPSNANFLVQKGDYFMDEKKYDDAFVQYDKAVSMGKADKEMYNIRASARIKIAQEKYNTTNTQELRSKMTPKETEQICTELKKAIALGLRDMKMDMFSSLVCK
jgi:tetratricopeptide (TPR) repeat protein